MATTHEEEFVARELKRAEILSTNLQTHSPSVAPVLNAQNAAFAQEGETMPDAVLELAFKARILTGTSQKLTDASTDLRDGIAARVLFGNERQLWFATTHGEMFAIQTIVRALGGTDALKRLGLSGTLAKTPEKLVLQGQHFRQLLTKPSAARTRSGEAAIDVSALAQRLEPPLSELELYHGLYLEADQNVVTARKLKNELLDELRLLNTTIGQETVAIFRRAGYKEVATRLRRQLSRVLEPSSNGNTTPPPAGQEDAPPAPTPDTPPSSTSEAPAAVSPDTTA